MLIAKILRGNAYTKLCQTTQTPWLNTQETPSQQDRVTFSVCCCSRWSKGARNIQSRKSLKWVNIWGAFMLFSSKGASSAANLSTRRILWCRESLSNTPWSNNAAFLQLLGGAEGASLSQGSPVQHHLGHEAQSWKARNSSASLKCPSLSESCQAQLYRTQSSLILKQAYVLMHFPLQSREL